MIDNNHNKYITTQEFNKLTVDSFVAILIQAKLATKSDVDDFVEKTDIDDKLNNLNKNVVSNKICRGWKETKWSNKKHCTNIRKWIWFFLIGRMYFTGDDGYQNFLVFVSMLSSLIVNNNKKATNWISLGI